MAAPTASELVAAMASRGVTITTADATGILCLVASITECLELNYPEDTCRQDAILLWASILIASNTAGRYITSHRAPSGASQSFGYGSKPWMVTTRNHGFALPSGSSTRSPVQSAVSSSFI